MKQRFVVAAMIAAVGVWVGTARAASFDCAKAKSPVERAICSNKDLSAADTEMATAYRAALAGLPAGSVSKLRIDQLRWLQWLQTGCGVPGTTDPAAKEPAKKPDLPALSRCMLGSYREHTEGLKHATARIAGVLFLTRSMYLLQPNSADDTSGAPAFHGFGQLVATWPEAQTNDPQWMAWNAGVVAAAQRAALQQDAAVAWDAANMADAVDASVEVTLPKVEGGRAHADVSYEVMGHGAAHPSEDFSKLTWLLTQKRALRVGDVFRAGTPWQRVMAEQCWAQLKSGDNASSLYDEVKGPKSEAVLRVISDVRNWTLTDTGISVSWPEYSVAPRVSPIDDTEVPWKALRPYLAPGFTLPRGL